MTVRTAIPEDFDRLYSLGQATPEFRVSATEPFMAPEEFRSALEHDNGAFVLAEDGDALFGFAYVSWSDLDAPPNGRWACLVYAVVASDQRHRGVATKLYAACTERARDAGATHIYAWANDESDGSMIAFLEKRGFTKGHRYVWMDRKL